MFGINPSNGRTNWWYKFESYYNTADPVVYGDKLFITERGDRYACALLQLRAGKLSTVWSNWVLRSECVTPVLYDDYLYGFDDGNLTCVDLADGTATVSGQP